MSKYLPSMTAAISFAILFIVARNLENRVAFVRKLTGAA